MAEPHGPPTFSIHVDGQHFQVKEASLSGAQIKQLVGKDASYQLFLETPGEEPDQLVGDTTSIALKNGMHFYTVPPATFGC